MPKISLQLPRPHSSQQIVLNEAKRWNVLACGRRWGKSTLAINLLAQKALQGYPVAYFAPSYKIVAEVWREFLHYLEPVIKEKNVQQKRIELLTKGSIEMWSLSDANTARGRKYARVFIDEAAFIPTLEEAWINVIIPTLADFGGDAWFGSTPKGFNFFRVLYMNGQDPLKAREWKSWSMPSWTNDKLPRESIEMMRETMTAQQFAQEIEASFLEVGGSVFRNIEHAIKQNPGSPADHIGHKVVSGVDFAIKDDYTCISSYCRTCGTEIDLDKWTLMDWEAQRARIAAKVQDWGIKHIIGEQNSFGGPNIEALSKAGIPIIGFNTSSVSKPRIIQALALSMERGKSKWINDRDATAELLSYEAHVNPKSQHISYSAPRGLHDDTVIARALAWEAAKSSGFKFV